MARGLAAQSRARTGRLATTRQSLRRSIARTGIRLPALAATLPTLAACTNTSAVTGVLWTPSDATSANKYDRLYTFLRATWGAAGAAFPNYQYWTPAGVTPSAGVSYAPAAPLIRFWSMAPDLEIVSKMPGSPDSLMYRIKVDGEYIRAGATGYAAGFGGYLGYQRITWGDGTAANAKLRLYEIECFGTVYFGGVKSSPLYRPMPAPVADGLRGLIHGDSFAEGYAGVSTATLHASLGALIPVLLGQPDTIASGVGGTGFVSTASGAKYNFGQRVQSDVIARAPDFVIDLGGYNDQSLVGGGAVFQAAVENWLGQLIGALPDVQVFMTGPMAPGMSSGSSLTTRDLKKAAAAKFANNVIFLDNVADEWVTGTGRSGAPAGNGNADFVTGGVDGTDGVHPTPEGHVYLAQRIVQAIAGALGSATG